MLDAGCWMLDTRYLNWILDTWMRRSQLTTHHHTHFQITSVNHLFLSKKCASGTKPLWIASSSVSSTVYFCEISIKIASSFSKLMTILFPKQTSWSLKETRKLLHAPVKGS